MLRIEPGASGCEVHMLPLCYAPPSRHLTFCHHDKKSLRSKEKISPTPNAYQIQNQQSPGLIKILGFTPPDFENGILTLAERQEMKRGNKQRIGLEALIRNNSICFCQKFGTAADNRRSDFRRKTFVGVGVGIVMASKQSFEVEKKFLDWEEPHSRKRLSRSFLVSQLRDVQYDPSNIRHGVGISDRFDEARL